MKCKSAQIDATKCLHIHTHTHTHIRERGQLVVGLVQRLVELAVGLAQQLVGASSNGYNIFTIVPLRGTTYYIIKTIKNKIKEKKRKNYINTPYILIIYTH